MHKKSDIFVDIKQKSLLTIDKRLNEIFASYGAEFPGLGGLSSKDLHQLKENLLRNLGFVRRLGTQIKYDERVYIRFTNEQYETFSQSLDNRFIVVNGVAGSGKTIIAKELAKEFARQGKRVLLLCFNRPIGELLRYELKPYARDNSITVFRYHQFARRVINEDSWWEKALMAYKASKKESEFWDLSIPEKMLLITDDNLEKYDAIVIDEGQDFREFWYETLLRHVNDEGHFVVFLDKNQDIFNHYTNLPKQHHFMSFNLKRNCRNGKNIIDYLIENTGIPIQAFNELPVGDYQIRKYKNDVEQKKQIRDDVITLIQNDKVRPEQILILIHSDIRDSCIKDMRKIDKYEIVSGYNHQKKGDYIRYATIEYYKGLESDVVLLTDTHLIESQDRKKLMYVEASRARHRLYIYEKE